MLSWDVHPRSVSLYEVHNPADIIHLEREMGGLKGDKLLIGGTVFPFPHQVVVVRKVEQGLFLCARPAWNKGEAFYLIGCNAVRIEQNVALMDVNNKLIFFKIKYEVIPGF